MRMEGNLFQRTYRGFCENAVLQLNNFKKLRGFGWKGFKKMNLWSQDKGQKECVDVHASGKEDNAQFHRMKFLR